MSHRLFTWLPIALVAMAITSLVIPTMIMSSGVDPVPEPHPTPSLNQNVTQFKMISSDYLNIELNQTDSRIAIVALNHSGYTLTPEVFGANYSGWQFVPTNGTLYYITITAPAGANSLLMYVDTNLMANYTQNSALNVTFTVVSNRPNTGGWNIFFGSLNIPYSIPMPPLYLFELIIVILGGLAIYGGYRSHAFLMYIGLGIEAIMASIIVGLLIVLVAFGVYIGCYFLLNRLDKRNVN